MFGKLSRSYPTVLTVTKQLSKATSSKLSRVYIQPFVSIVSVYCKMSVIQRLAEEAEKWSKKEQQHHESRYSSKVRMGNWSEELILREEKLKCFLKQREKGELLIQKTRKTLSNLLKEVPLLLPGDYVSYGNTCQLLAPELCTPRAPSGLVLAGVASTKEVDSCQHFQDGSLVSASPHTQPCVRNCFRISSADNNCREGEKLMYGQPFALGTIESPYGLPLWIESEVPHLHSILGQSKHPLLRLTSFKNIYSLWRAVPMNPADREDLWDTPVMANTPVIISHVASNKNLSLEPSFWFTTYFGVECEVSVHTDLNIYKRETANNLWVMVTNRPQQQQQLW